MQSNSMPYFKNKSVNIESDLKEFPNILQQKKKVCHKNLLIGQKEY